jgi:hypothetical protein
MSTFIFGTNVMILKKSFANIGHFLTQNTAMYVVYPNMDHSNGSKQIANFYVIAQNWQNRRK